MKKNGEKQNNFHDFISPQIKSLLNGAPWGTIVIDTTGIIQFFNSQAIGIIGPELKSSIGKQLNEVIQIICGSIENDLANIVEQVVQQDTIIDLSLDCFLITKSGAQIPAIVKFAPWKNENSKIIGILVHFATRTKDDLLKYEIEQIKQLFEEGQNIAWIGNWEFDFKTGQLFWSAEVFRIFEMDPADSLSSFESFLELVHPEDRDLVQRTFKKSIQNRTLYEIEHRILTQSGKVKYVRGQGKTLYDGSGRPSRTVGIVQDITEFKNIERKLLQSEQKTKSILSSLTDTILVIDKDGVILEVFSHETNPLPVSTNIFLGKKYTDVLSKEASDLITASINELHKTKIPQTFQNQLKVDNNEKQYFETTISFLSEDKYVAVVRDITLRKKLEIELEYIKTFKKILLELAIEFIDTSPEKFERKKDRALKMIINFLKVDRAYIFKYDFDKNIMSNTYEKCLPGISPQIDNLQDIPLDMFPEWVNSHLKGDLIHIPDVSTLPEGDNLREILEAQDIKTLITFPISYKGHCFGFLGFDSVTHRRNWTAAEIDLLKLFANLLANAEHHIRIDSQIRKDFEHIAFLVSEIHHRVKNNLQIIASLLHLQSRTLNNKEVMNFVNDTKNRISMIAAVHEMLYKTRSFTSINFREYLQNTVAKQITYSHLNKQIKLKLQVKDIDLPVDDAIPLAILLYELISNSTKYAFPNEKTGIIKISFQQLDQETYQLIYQDNGIGLPSDFDFETSESFGFQLIRMLTDQIGGKVTFKQNGWTTFDIVFKGYSYAKKNPNRRR